MSSKDGGLEARISELESTIAALREERETPPKDEGRFGRRRLLRMAAAAVGGGVAAPLLLSQTASANNGDNLIIGNVSSNSSATDGNAAHTVLYQHKDSAGNYTHFSVKQSAFDNAGDSAFTIAAHSPLWGIGAVDNLGIYGFAAANSGTGVGIFGASDGGWGVKAATLTGVDLSLAGTGRLSQLPSVSGPPTYSGIFEQVRDTWGSMYVNFGLSNVWAPVLVGGDNKGIFEKVVTTQPTLSASDGVTWNLIDPGLKVTFTTLYPANALCTGNADLWTWVAGYNQDIAIGISGGAFGAGTSTTPGTVVAWKESGGFAGTFSPNAAFVQGIARNLAGNTAYTVGLYWKTNVPNGAGGRGTPSKISAGAGQSPNFSPTRLVVQLIPIG